MNDTADFLTAESSDSGPDDLRSFRACTDAQVETLVRELLLGAQVHRVWLLLFDDSARIMDLLLPFEDLPPNPHELVETPDLGELTHAEVFARRAASILDLVDGVSICLVWERPTGDELSPGDRDWIDACARAADAIDLPLRAQVVLRMRSAQIVQPG